MAEPSVTARKNRVYGHLVTIGILGAIFLLGLAVMGAVAEDIESANGDAFEDMTEEERAELVTATTGTMGLTSPLIVVLTGAVLVASVRILGRGGGR